MTSLGKYWEALILVLVGAAFVVLANALNDAQSKAWLDNTAAAMAGLAIGWIAPSKDRNGA